MGALSLLRAMRSAAAGSVPRSPNLVCDSPLKRGELLHPRDTGAPLPAAPIPSSLAVADDVQRPPRTAPEQPERYKNGTSNCAH
jgi:hypothetical protein